MYVNTKYTMLDAQTIMLDAWYDRTENNIGADLKFVSNAKAP
jgi:hypothetical protein